MFRSTRRWSGTMVWLLLVTAPPGLAQNVPNAGHDPADLWADFNHYVIIARPDLAQAAGQVLLEIADNSQLLDVVEAGDYDNYLSNLQRARHIESLEETATELEDRIQAARIARSRDAQRISGDIQSLNQGQRPYRNAVERLRAAGQYAAPQLLATLQNDKLKHLHPYAIEAMIAIGKPLVYPLSAAIVDLDPVTQGQIAQVLAEIGYPQPLPQLKQILEDAATDDYARGLAQAAYDNLLETSDLSGHLDAATLYLLLGQQQYGWATSNGTDLPGFDAAEGKGIVWEYSDRVGLVPVPVPGPIFGDVLAMRSARQSLRLNSDLDQALSLHLMANLRRENRLPEAEEDPSYPSGAESAAYYAMLSGPLRLHDVLAQAMDDQDASLALDTIAALTDTAGTDALVRRDAATRPLMRALSYPDRRVRFRAAEALAIARPTQDFGGAFRVVPVLAEAVRQSASRYALVISPEQQSLNQLAAAINDLGFEAIGSLSLAGAADQINASPGIDLIVTDLNPGDLDLFLEQTNGDYKLGAVPVLALVAPEVQAVVAERARQLLPRLISGAAASDDPQRLGKAVEDTVASYAGTAMDAGQSTTFALMALGVLRDVALASDVYNIVDAQPALIQALADDRPDIVVGAATVLSLINTPEAQIAIADYALRTMADVQLALLESLADSATHFGNLLNDPQKQQLIDLVSNSDGELAATAARAHGALTLPTSEAVKEILRF